MLYAWADRPAAASNTGAVIRITDVGGSAGSLWISNGTYWVPYSGICVLGMSAVALSNAADTAELALATINIPEGIMGTSGLLRIMYSVTTTNSANNKNIRIRLGGIGGTQFAALTHTTSVTGRYLTEIQNRGATNSQVAGTAQGNSAFQTNANALMVGTVNTAIDNTLVITGNKASAGETLTLERYSVELLNQ